MSPSTAQSQFAALHPGAAFAPRHVRETRPDYVLILPWNLREEIVQSMAHVREWGGRFVVSIPTVTVLS
jgi:hypothetical protein